MDVNLVQSALSHSCREFDHAHYARRGGLEVDMVVEILT